MVKQIFDGNWTQILRICICMQIKEVNLVQRKTFWSADMACTAVFFFLTWYFLSHFHMKKHFKNKTHLLEEQNDLLSLVLYKNDVSLCLKQDKLSCFRLKKA